MKNAASMAAALAALVSQVWLLRRAISASSIAGPVAAPSRFRA